MMHLVDPKNVSGDIVQHLVALTDGAADYLFDCSRNMTVVRKR